MGQPHLGPCTSDLESRRRSCWPWVLIAGSLVVVLLALLLPRQRTSPSRPNSTDASRQSPLARGRADRAQLSRGFPEGARTPEEIVAGKVIQFAQDRLRFYTCLGEKQS
jgi:hypothetical protein